jgi:L-fucose mutarotase/ribose pyranase (RbsD/FucU family)
VTVRVVLPEMLPDAAEIVVLPTATPVATPEELIVAVAGVPEAQVTDAVMSWVLLSEYVPVAWKGTVVPAGADGLAGVTEMDFKVAAVTVSVVLSAIPPDVAEMVLLPTATAVATPAELMVAAAGAPEAQVTAAVMSLVLLSEYVPVAWKGTVVPAGADGLAGVTEMDFKVAAVTVSVVLPDALPDVAEIVVLCPAVPAVARPAALIVAAVVFDEAQVTDAVMSFVPLSEYVPVALNCTVVPPAADWMAGVTAIDVSIGGCVPPFET